MKNTDPLIKSLIEPFDFLNDDIIDKVSFLNKLIKTRKLTTLQVSFQYLHMVSCCAKIILL